MLNSETMDAVGRLIENFGFPVFVALCALVFFWQMFVYMRAAAVKKDDDFLAYIQAANKQLADYISKRDEQINCIIENHNRAFREDSFLRARSSEPVYRRRISRQQDKKRRQEINS